MTPNKPQSTVRVSVEEARELSSIMQRVLESFDEVHFYLHQAHNVIEGRATSVWVYSTRADRDALRAAFNRAYAPKPMPSEALALMIKLTNA